MGLAGGGSTVAELPPGTSVRRGIAELRSDPGVRFAAPNWIAHASVDVLDQGDTGQPGGWEADQWSFLGRPGGIRVGPAWQRLEELGRPGGIGPTVAVVDTGVAYATATGFARQPGLRHDAVRRPASTWSTTTARPWTRTATARTSRARSPSR